MDINNEIAEDSKDERNTDAKTLGEYVDRLKKAAKTAEDAMIKMVKEYRSGTVGIALDEALDVARSEKLSDVWPIVFAVEEILAGRDPEKE